MNQKILKKIDLLSIDDSSPQVNIFKEELNLVLQNLYTSNCLKKSMDLFMKHDPHLVLINMNSYYDEKKKLIENLKNIKPNLVVVIISNPNNLPNIVEILDVHVSRYLVEPVSREKLFQTIVTHSKELFYDSTIKRDLEVLQNVINADKNMLVATRNGKIYFSNKSFLNFFMVDNNDEFLSKYKDLYGIFVKDQDFLHKGLIEENESFVDLIFRTETIKRIVKLFDYHDFTFKAFYLNAFSVSNNLYMLNFTDITKVTLDNIDIHQKAYFDGLTNIYNRNKIDTILEYEIKQSKRYEESLCFIIVDIDDFKVINDTYGHLIGDEILILMAKTISDRIRETDVFGRWGGEEFAILLPKTNIKEACILAEDLRKIVQRLNHSSGEKITASFGVSSFRMDDNYNTIFNRADEALYKAKQNGKNRVETVE